MSDIIKAGRKAIITRVVFDRHREYLGQVGTITRVYKTRKTAVIETEIGKFESSFGNFQILRNI